MNTTSKKILFVVPLGDRFPSGVRRAIEYIPYLERRGWKADVVSYGSMGLLKIGLFVSRLKRMLKDRRSSMSPIGDAEISEVEPFSPMFIRAWRNAIDLSTVIYNDAAMVRVCAMAHRSDVVFFQHVTPPIVFTKMVRLLNDNIVFDIDDAIFLMHPERTRAIVEAAKVATPGSHYNKAYCERYTDKVVFLPTPVEATRFDCGGRDLARGNPRNRFTIGWIGSTNTVPHLDVVREPLSRLGRRHPGKIKVILVGADGAGDRLSGIDGVEIEVIPWVKPEKIPELTMRLDAGIMPLVDSEWEKGKCGGKALEYMAARLPAVCSDIGENRYIVEDGVNGFLASDHKDWEEKIEMLMSDPNLAARLGAQGRRTIEERYSTAVCFEILEKQVLDPLVEQRRAAARCAG